MSKELEILKLKQMLEDAKIPFEFTDDLFRGLHKPSYQIKIYDKENQCLCDVIYHYGSYGYNQGLLEIMGALTEEEQEDDSVKGYLTAKEVFKRFKYCYENNTNTYNEGKEYLEAIECLEIIYDGYCSGYGINVERFKTIKQALIKSHEQEELLKTGDLSDGYHTFNQLYYQRCVLFASLVKLNKDKSWKSFKHSDGKYCFDSNGEWFIVGIDTPTGSYTYHYEKKYWNLFECQELECGKEWDGHTEEDVTRLLSLSNEQEKENTKLKGQVKYLTEVGTELQKILSIIKKKGIDISWLRQCNTVEEYNYHCESNPLTQEEFDILMRWLKNDN